MNGGRPAEFRFSPPPQAAVIGCVIHGMKTHSYAIALAVVTIAPAPFPAYRTADDDPAKLYLQAAKQVNDNAAKDVMCPAASNLSYDDVPPFPTAWYTYEEADFPANAAARALAHRARSLDHPQWPASDPNKPDLECLNDMRALANELADAAVYEHLTGDDAAAVETVRDELHLADLMDLGGDKEYLVILLVAEGIRASAMSRLTLVAADLHVSDDKADTAAVRTATVKDLIAQLCKLPDPTAAVQASLDRTLAAAKTNPTPDGAAAFEKSRAAATRTAKRANAECGMAALSLACHLYRADRGGWPTSLADLKPYCPDVPLDPFGDGKRPLGYAVIPHGLPDGGDRPLVYARETDDGTLAYRDEQSAYSYYAPAKVKGKYVRRGQFRDVVLWKAAPDAKPSMVPYAEP